MKKKINRRDFLRIASIGTASALALSCGMIQTPPRSSTEEPESMTQTDLNTDNSSPSADVLVLGEYSHIPLFASGDHYDALFAPVDDVLFFAGEATSREYPSTVHGAYLSGIAAAGEM